MKASRVGNVVKLSGVIDEKVDLKNVASVIETTASETGMKAVKVDFSDVKRANSLGIIKWRILTEELSCGVIYENSPQWLVEQFNFEVIPILKGSLVASILAPFYCGEDGTHEMVRLEVGKDIPLMKDYSSLRLERPSKNGRMLEPDFEPSDYFEFLLIYGDLVFRAA